MQKALFLYNPAAGRGRIARNVGGIVDIFSENGWELTPEKIDFGRNPFDAHPDIRMVVAAGGDGTVKRDQIRNEYYEKFTGIRRDDPHYYDMVINVSKTGAAGAAGLILDYIKNKEEKGGNAS